jgi:kinesin light chain
VLIDLGDLKQAGELYARALDIRVESLGPEHPDVAYTLDGLATLADTSGDPELALEYLQRSLPIWENALGSEHPKTAGTLEEIADVCRRLGRDDEADEAAARAAEIRAALDS